MRDGCAGGRIEASGDRRELLRVHPYGELEDPSVELPPELSLLADVCTKARQVLVHRHDNRPPLAIWKTTDPIGDRQLVLIVVVDRQGVLRTVTHWRDDFRSCLSISAASSKGAWLWCRERFPTEFRWRRRSVRTK